MLKRILLLTLLAFPVMAWAQDEVRIFNNPRIVNLHSVEMQRKGYMAFVMSHRFGDFNDDFLHNFMGLDNATVRLALNYGVTDRLMLGVGRSTYLKTYDGYLKYQALRQGPFPLSLALFAETTVTTDRNYVEEEVQSFVNKLAYNFQFLLAKKIGHRWAFEVAPSFVHLNLVKTKASSNDIFSVGMVGSFKLSRSVDINVEYVYIPNAYFDGPAPSPLSIGFDIESKGHNFQLFVSNSRGMNGPRYLSTPTGDWLDGDIFFGFNISRDFRIKAYQP